MVITGHCWSHTVVGGELSADRNPVLLPLTGSSLGSCTPSVALVPLFWAACQGDTANKSKDQGRSVCLTTSNSYRRRIWPKAAAVDVEGGGKLVDVGAPSSSLFIKHPATQIGSEALSQIPIVEKSQPSGIFGSQWPRSAFIDEYGTDDGIINTKISPEADFAASPRHPES